MNLLHFLSVSQSFVGGKDAPSPYRIYREDWLPRFGPHGADRRVVEAMPAPAMLPAVPEPKGDASSGANSARPPAPQTPAYRLSPRSGERLRQTELFLESVQVVRNDLSDSDFEIVRRRPSAHVIERTTSTFAAIERFGGKSGLNWLAARFFRLGRTQV